MSILSCKEAFGAEWSVDNNWDMSSSPPEARISSRMIPERKKKKSSRRKLLDVDFNSNSQ